MRMTCTLQYHKNILGHAVVNVILPKEYNCDEWENILQYFSFYIKTKQSFKSQFLCHIGHIWNAQKPRVGSGHLIGQCR